jgi:hypothetical protein
MDQVTEAAIELPRHYIEIEGSLVHGPRRSLKHGEAFALAISASSARGRKGSTSTTRAFCPGTISASKAKGRCC